MKMKTIVIACLKGGVGKSLHAAHLCVSLESMGFGPVVTMDLDGGQATHAKWWNRRSQFNETAPAFQTVTDEASLLIEHAKLKASGAFNYCVIDTPPQMAQINRAAIKLADLVIIPCKHAVGDLEAVMPTVDLCDDEGKKFIFLVNETNGEAVAREARDKLAAVGPVIPGHIPKNNRYWQSLAKGQGITEFYKGTPSLLVQSMTQFVVDRVERRAHV
jgi:chromosome partitioning protein